MITEKDLQISNLSATKKDFYQIYPEILELVTKITSRWNPDSSNESDPGIVLLKLLAFIADKNDYNIDKNTLEAFMPSATQEQSMRNLCSMMGYEMKYYQSAVTSVSFMYQGTAFADDSTVTYIKLPAFSTVVTNSDGDVNYVVTNDVIIHKKYETVSAEAIEGTLCDVTANNSSIVTLSNLDDDNKFYLPENAIAENGIWIKSAASDALWSADTWKKVSNLNTQVSGSTVWKFGYDSHQQLPYIQFPSDITSLIGDGLNIRYVRTTGVNGNVSANVLTALSSGSSATDNNGNSVNLTNTDTDQLIVISNKSAAVTGQDKETIDSAYVNFKKTVGTFDTLVTCRDYANAIYALVSSTDNTTPLVSNVITSDIRDDLNDSISVLTYGAYGKIVNTVQILSDGVAKLPAYCLKVYCFKPIAGSYTKDSYINSFKNDISNWELIQASLQDYKSSAHLFSLPADSDISCIKNYYNLEAKLTTTYKVNALEKQEILNNVYNALYKTFNMRQVDFGEKIPSEAILECIEGADTRIKNVALNEPELTTKVLFANGNESSLNTVYAYESGSATVSSSPYLDLLVRNILAGKVSLLDYDTRFEFDYGQTKNSSYDTIYGGANSTDKILRLTTGVDISVATDKSLTPNSYKLKTNEFIEMMSPSLVTTTAYSAYVNYHMKLNTPTASIAANTEYKLVSGDILYINYTDSDDKVHDIKYTNTEIYNYVGGILQTQTTVPQNIIRPNFLLQDSQTIWDASTHKWGKTDGSFFIDHGDISGMYSMSSSQEIDLRGTVSTSLKTVTYCYWIVNNTVDKIATIAFDSNNEYILKDGEYFFYTNDAKTELVTLSSGTKLKVVGVTAPVTWTLDYSNHSQVSLDDIANNGLSAFANVSWLSKQFSTSSYLEIQEMSFVTLVEGDTLTVLNVDSSSTETSLTLTNDWTSVAGGSYVLDGTVGSLAVLSIAGFSWKVRSGLNLNIGPKLDQKLIAGEYVKLYKTTTPVANETPLVTITGTATGPTLRTNYLLQQAGGENIITTVLQIVNGVQSQINDLAMYVFDYTAPTYKLAADAAEQTLPMKTIDNYYTSLDLSAITATGVDFVNLPIVVVDGFAIIMFYYTPGSGIITDGTASNNGVTITTTGAYLKKYNTVSVPTTSVMLSSGINIIKITSSCALTFNNHSDMSGGVVFDALRLTASASDEGLDVDTLAIASNDSREQTASVNYILSKITALAGTDFYYNASLDTNSLLDETTMSDVETWYDYNNVNNKFVISELYAGNENDDSTQNPFPKITLTKSSLL